VDHYHSTISGTTCDGSKHTTMSWYDVLHCLNEEEGLIAEAAFQTYFGALPSIVSAVTSLHNRTGGVTLQMGLEEFSEDFDGSVRRLFTFFQLPKDEV